MNQDARRTSVGNPDEPDEAGRPATGRSGARFPSARQRKRFESAEPEPPPAAEPQRPPRAPRPPTPRQRTELAITGDSGEDDTAEQHRLRVRPYVLTRGRTQAARALAVETLISVEPSGPWRRDRISSEYQAVRRLCVQPRSVAEVAATLAVPLGVARILLSDMADEGLVNVHENRTTPHGRPDFDLMERILEGLHRL
ncbi:DUF742 domain-containing protein [Qaidamihabitans albus]|uniref:DUF742 domain-containing protein n=1 Tax=Qaidamihabitans albus TaxID=2795733 RepID=UPI0018F23C4A|nr:DUF742 domain-containing protein [Qaidamihabitans albus]